VFKLPIHFGELHSQLLPFCEYVFGLVKSPVEVQPQILDIFVLRKVYVIYMDWAGGGSLLVANVTWTVSYSLDFILNFL
jgi:hypothetical protein